jgi:acyl transferase domain-containing protein
MDESVNPSESRAMPQAAASGGIAIVGIGCMFPKADGLEAYWSNIKRGVDAITDIPATHWKPDQYFDSDPSKPDMTYAKRGGFLEPVDFNPLHHGITPNNLEATDTTQLLGLMVAEQALRDADYETGRGAGDGRAFNRDRTSVILGVTGTLELVIPLGARLGHPIWRKALDEAGVDKATADDVVQRIADGYVPWQENSFPGLLGNVAAGRIANRFDLGGSNCVVDAACASSLSAIHMAAMELQTGRMDMVLTGGLDTFNDIFMYMCFSKTPALSPTGSSKPFSADGDGTILGEGLGIVVLKRLDDAVRDGDKIYCVIKGIGSSSDGKGNAIYAPSAAGQVKCLTSAYREANVSPRTIELVEAHGTGTKVGDGVEIKALREVYENSSEFRVPSSESKNTEPTSDAVPLEPRNPEPGTRNSPHPWAAVGSVKSMIGHTKAAAGVAGLIKAAMAVNRKVLPPTIKVSQPLDVVKPGESPVYLNTERRPWLPRKEHPRRAAVSAFGFGGSNFHCVLEEASPYSPPSEGGGGGGSSAQSTDEVATAKVRFDHSGTVIIAPISGDSLDSLRTQLNALSDIAAKSWPAMRSHSAALRASFNPQHRHRLVLVIERDRTDLTKLIATFQRKLDAQQKHAPSHIATADGSFYATGEPRKIAFLFPGQGSQYVGMLRDLACDSSLVLDSLASANAAHPESPRGERLSDRIYPIPVFNDAAREANEAALRDTRVAQPALGAVSLGALRLLQSFNITPAAAAGHSFGELVALHAAGRIDEVSLHALANLRGKLMAEAGAYRTDKGAMLAVIASIPQQIESLITELNLSDIVIANRNTPTQVVLSGSAAQIDLAAKACEDRGLRARMLPVSAAFHSPFVADAQSRFAAGLAPINFAAGSIPVYANTTAATYPTDANEARALLAGQLASPVDFTGMIERMFAAGIDTFVEVGPKATLTGLVKSILGERGHLALSIDQSAGKRSGEFDLASLLAQLAALGHAVALARWDASFKADSPAPAGKKPALTVKLSGANYVKPRPAKPPLLPRPLAASRLIGAAAPGPASTSPFAVTSRSEPQNTPARPDSTPGAVAPSSPLSPSPLPRHSPLTSPSQPSPQLSQALALTQQNILALQRSQEQMAQLHRQYLEGQDAAQRTIQQLLEQQGQLLASSLGMSAAPRGSAPVATIPTPHPQPMPVAPAPAVATQPPAATAAPSVGGPARPGSKKVEGSRKVEPQANDRIRAALLAVVADKTGYPAEMLELSMSLDADLGIDSIKRVEILSALQEKLPDAPAVKPEHLGTLQTLGQIVAFLEAGAPSGGTATATAIPASVSAGSAAPEVAPPAGPAVSQAQSVLLQVVADKTGYPVEMLELDMSLDADLGIDSIKRVEILSALQERMPEAPVVKPEHLGELQTLRQIVDFLAAGSTGPVKSGSSPAGSSTHPAAPAAPTPDHQTALLSVVADKTGYPVEMLELDMSLDADLGIDSIKRVEILSALQERLPDAPIVKPEHLGSLQTLRQIVAFLGAEQMSDKGSRAGIQAETGPAIDGHRTAGSAPGKESPLLRQVVTLAPLAASTNRKRLRLPSHTPVWITDDGEGLAGHLRAAFLEQNIEATIVPVDADPNGQTLAGLIVLSPASVSDEFIRKAFKLVQRSGSSLKQAHAATSHHVLLAAVTRLGGGFALNPGDGAIEPLTAALAGIIKTAGHEWPQVACKVIDLATPQRHQSELSEDLVDELLREGPIEVGMTAAGRTATSLQPLALDESQAGSAPLESGDVVVITGGARGVTARVAVAIAREYRATLLLLGRSDAPTAEPNWLGDAAGEGAMKKAIAARLAGATPRAVEAEYRKAAANREVLDTLRRIEAAGGKALYRSADVRDAAAVDRIVSEVRRSHGPIRGIIHGAGVLADRLIEDKTDEQFALVFGTKVEGFRALLDATRADDLRVIVAFSSSTARFGRRGQVDYAAANEVLNKLAQQQAAARPGCRVVSVNWGPWDGGMVTPALRKVFEGEGVGVIGLDAGAAYLAREIATAAGGPVEIVILGPGSSLSAHAGGNGQPAPLSSASSSPSPLALAFEREVSVDAMPVLRSHVIGGKAVLPMALMMEWLAHGAMHDNPGLALAGLNDLRVYKGVKVEGDGAVMLQVLAGRPTAHADGLAVNVELRDGATVHARATVTLAAQAPRGHASPPPAVDAAPAKAVLAAYESGTLFHGPQLHAIGAITGNGDAGITGESSPAPAPGAWMKQPIRSAWLADPMALDAAFQLMIVWTHQRRGACSLPTGLASYRQFARRFPADGTRIAARVTRVTDHEAAADIEFTDRAGNLIARIEGYTSVIDASLKAAFSKSQLAAGAAV